MKQINIKNIKIKVYTVIFYLLCLLLLIIFSNRLLYTISLYDEVGNITLAYKVVLNQKPFVDIWEFHQVGAIFYVPFIYIFSLLKGNTEGLILFLRISYLFINIIVAFIVTRITKNIVNKKLNFLIGLAIVTYAPFSLYYLWYDTAGVLFMLLGATFIILGNNVIGIKKDLYLFYAGICHACMCYAYPSFITVVILYVILLLIFDRGQKLIRKIIDLKGYIAGGLLIGSIVIFYLLINKDTVFFFNKSILATNMSGRDYTIMSRVYGILWGSFVFFKNAVLPTIILLYIYAKSFSSKYKNTYKIIFLTGISVVSYYTLRDKSSYAIFMHFFYLFLYTPLLYYFLNNKHKRIAKNLICYLWFPSIVSYFAVGFTALGGGAKSTFGVYTGSVCTIIIMAIIIQEIISELQLNKTIKPILSNICLISIIVTNIMLFYNTGFDGRSVSESTYKVENGIFKGLYTKESDSFYIELEELVKRYVNDNDKTIFFTDSLQCGYLFTDLVPAEAHIWNNYIKNNDIVNEWENQFLYFNQVTGLPSIIVCKVDYESEKPEKFKKLLEFNYREEVRTDSIVIYKLNQS